MKIVFAGALLAVAALIANVSLAEETPEAPTSGPVDELPAEIQPCVEAGADPMALAAMPPSGTGENVVGPSICPQSGPDYPEPHAASAGPEVLSVVAGPILVGPPPRKLTAQRIYRP